MADWKVPVDDLYDIDDEFYEFICSLLEGFQNKVGYRRLELYSEQSRNWMNDLTSFHDNRSKEWQSEYVQKEWKRCNENGLYWLNKYWKYKDDENQESGFTQYTAEEAQEIFAFLIDSGYNMIVPKARQIFATTTVFGLSARDVMLNRSTFVKIISSDQKKAEETFQEKFKDVFYELDWYMKPKLISSDAAEKFVAHRNKKEHQGAGSQVKITTASETAVNSGNPKKTYIDEAGLIKVLYVMIKNWEPTALRFNPVTKKLEPKGQLVAWGTSDKTNNPEFESIVRNAIERFKSKKFRKGMLIPVYFNCYARAGFTKELYDQYYEDAYNETGPNAQRARLEFHQAFPDKIDDMFLVTGDTLIPAEDITRLGYKTLTAKPPHVGRYGYFEPEYDHTKPMSYGGEQYYVIKGAKFIETGKETHMNTTCYLLREPDLNWVDRYYKGTDPIDTPTGKSKFACAIFDALMLDIPCVMYHREQGDHKYSFEQSICMMLYYGIELEDLVESNAGASYIDFMKEMGYARNLVTNMQLPKLMQTPGSNLFGINKKGNTGRVILNNTYEFIQLCKENIYIPRLWFELKTYVKKETPGGAEKYAPKDKNYHFDDVIDACTYAYINYLCHQWNSPKEKVKIVRHREGDMELDYDANFNVILRPRNR